MKKAGPDNGFVADSSIAISWVIRTQASAETDRLLDAVADGSAVWVPALWLYETANVLHSLARRGRLSADQFARARRSLRELGPNIDDLGFRENLDQTTDLAGKFFLSVHDAAYLELAIRLRLPLATRDEALIAAAHTAKVAVLP